MTNGKDSAFAKSAFYHPDGGIDIPQEGLTKREYFAAMAMQGMLANNRCEHELIPEGKPYLGDMKMKYCVGIADELINALNKEQ